MVKQRVEYLDYVRGMAILLVVLGHMYNVEDPIRILIYSFHMPLFFIISGFFAKNDIGLLELIKKKFKVLMIPYFAFGGVIMLIMYATNGFDEEFAIYIRHFITGVGRDALWFLVCLFLIEIIFNIVMKLKYSALQYITFISLFIIGLYGEKIHHDVMIGITLFRVFVGLGFYALGYYIYKYINKINLPYFVLIALFLFNSFLAFENTWIDLWALRFGNRLIYVTCSVLGSVSMILIFKKLGDLNRFKYVFKFFGSNTLTIMATQQIIINYVNRFTKQQYYIGFKGFYMFLLVIIIEIPIIYVVNNYASWILGNFKNKNSVEAV